MSDPAQSPALVAAQAADAKMLECLASGRSFLLEAGAGAGKTYSLVEALKLLIKDRSKSLRRDSRRIACITYTNAATAVINSRIDGNEAVFTDTIHSFCWSTLKGFQGALRKEVAELPAWQERLAVSSGIKAQAVEYDLGYRKITDEVITLHHDDILALMVKLLPIEKFRRLVAEQYPFILIDEYQDTNDEIMGALKAAFLDKDGGSVIGLFGDHWQRIYDKTCGYVVHERIEEIGKGANFRSSTAVVEVLNRMRPELPQAIKDPTFVGSVAVYHTNGWGGQRRTGAGGGHWKDDLPASVAHTCLLRLIEQLKQDGWDFSAEKTKILMLTHNVLANEQGYASLMGIFPFNDLLMKKEDELIAFFADKVEPACAAYHNKRYGEMFSILGESSPRLSKYEDKVRWSKNMAELIALREGGTIGQVLDQIIDTGFPRLPEGVFRRNKEAIEWTGVEGEDVPEAITRIRKLRDVAYAEIIALDAFIDGHTPFATKHSVKGDEFENVLVVVGRGWNKYNFDQYLDWARVPANVPADKVENYERNRNLFYVACSRPTTRLALLFTQKLSAGATQTLTNWFGAAQVHAFAPE
jgi:DNA helicase-2/ATP-dependent DNA helicase PcrA